MFINNMITTNMFDGMETVEINEKIYNSYDNNIHPTAYIGDNVIIGNGNTICANAIIEET